MERGVVVIIEADEQVRSFFVKQVLEPLEYRVLSAADQRQGLEQALLLNPDLILLGDSAPNPRINSFLSILKQSTCSSPIILVTTDDSKDKIIDAFRQGISDFILLPTKIDGSREIIKHVVEKSQEMHKREELDHRLIMIEGVEITMTTLSHYINNYLMALNGNLLLLQESLRENKHVCGAPEIIQKSLINLSCIKKVLQVLLNSTSISFVKYDDSIPMIDIHDRLMVELNRIEKKDDVWSEKKVDS